MEDKTVLIGALALGAVVVVLMMRGGSGGGVQTLGSMPTSDSSGERAQAFSSLLDLGREELDVNRDLALGRIQGAVENNRIFAAERASLAESEAQIRLANIQADSQSNSSFFDFLGSVASIALPLAL